MNKWITAAVALLGLPATTLGQAEYSLHELVAPDGTLDTIAVGIDDQGRVVGSSRLTSGRVAVLWPAIDAAPLVLGSLEMGMTSEATAIAGGLVVGVSGRSCGSDGAFAWLGEIEPLGPDSCVPSRAVDINGSGRALLLVGESNAPWVWPVGAGTPSALETWGQPAVALGIDNLGGVLGASAFHPEGLGRTRAVRWNADGSARLLAPLDPDATGPDSASDANGAGLIVGQSRLGTVGRAAAWDAEGVPIDAGEALGPMAASRLRRVNEGGQAVGVSEGRAIVWDRATGARVLAGLVDESGDGWALLEATDLNDRGQIVGNGRRPDGRTSGFVLVPLGGTCRADLDGDGELTIFDFLEFQNLFASGDPRADFDGDGQLTIFDFLEFQNAFAAGCP